MVATTKRGGQFHIHIIPAKEDLIVAGMRLLLVVTVSRSIALRRGLTLVRDGQNGEVKQVPMSLARVGEAVNQAVFILITRT